MEEPNDFQIDGLERPGKPPRELEWIVAAFMPILRHIKKRFERMEMALQDLCIGQKDLSNRLGLMEKRMDNFEVQVDNE